MKLSEFIDKPISEVLKDMELKVFNVISDNGVVKSIELKYTPKERVHGQEPIAGDNRNELFKSHK